MKDAYFDLYAYLYLKEMIRKCDCVQRAGLLTL